MDSERMVIPALTDLAEHEGRQLLANLDKLKVKVSAALWAKDADTEKWSLILSMPDASKHGIRWCYRRVQQAIELTGNEIPFDLGRVKIISYNDPLLRALRLVLGHRPGSGNVRLTSCRINDFYIHDVFVYRL
jgi:hypothetical protein